MGSKPNSENVDETLPIGLATVDEFSAEFDRRKQFRAWVFAAVVVDEKSGDAGLHIDMSALNENLEDESADIMELLEELHNLLAEREINFGNQKKERPPHGDSPED